MLSKASDYVPEGLFVANCVDFMRDMPEGCVDLVVTSHLMTILGITTVTNSAFQQLRMNYIKLLNQAESLFGLLEIK